MKEAEKDTHHLNLKKVKQKLKRDVLWRQIGLHDKTLWNFLELALIPIFLTIGAFILDALANEREQRIITERYQQEELSKYFDQMTRLLLEQNLTQPGPQETEKAEKARVIARLRTLSTLRVLGEQQKGVLIRFLFEAELITCTSSMITAFKYCSSFLDLKSADLRSAYLYSANLYGANLEGTDLSGADLSYTNLINANLKNAKLDNTRLRSADLQNANLSGARVNGTDLKDALLCNTKMPDGTLSKRNCAGQR